MFDIDSPVVCRLQGQQDPPLNARGQRQADALACSLQNGEFSGRIFSSDLSRALQTAECVSRTAAGDGPLVQSSPAFRERSLGVLEVCQADSLPGLACHLDRHKNSCLQ